MDDQHHPAIQVTNATEAEAPLVYNIMKAAFAEYLGVLTPPSGVHAETVDDVIRAMHEGGAVLAWLDDDTAVGSARYAYHADYFYVGRVSVLPGYRGHGIASAMMNFMEGIAHGRGYNRVEIGVRAVLAGNINLYQRLGYEITDTFEHPLGGGTMLTMSKLL
jgi:GNAT superfamily N-acetyltransferase